MVPYKCQDCCSVSEKCHWNFVKNCIERVYSFGWNEHFSTTDSFSSTDTGYHPSYLHLQFLHQCQYFQCAGISSPWLNLFLGILFFLMQLQTDFLSLSDGLLLVFRNEVDFCVLIW